MIFAIGLYMSDSKLSTFSLTRKTVQKSPVFRRNSDASVSHCFYLSFSTFVPKSTVQNMCSFDHDEFYTLRQNRS